MTKNECFNLGYISRKVGNHGELAFTLDVDDPSRYYKLKSVFIELNNSLVPFFIKKIQGRTNTLTVKIDGIDTIERAEELLKSSLFLPLTMLPPLSGKKFYFHEMPGYTVTDAIHGDIGIIEEILNFPQQAIFKIKKGVHEILIPAKEEFIIALHREKRHIELNAPEGLIDLYITLQDDDPSEKETDQE
ncbi:MAG: ribosome maturation factor RimM [Bacteroidia bacterium]